ncbi:MAG TPA: hypothetical protein VFG94_04380 [Acidimicrobiales bacterium]|nr:hypothetical protein [Acidimicrobiales bacterium]
MSRNTNAWWWPRLPGCEYEYADQVLERKQDGRILTKGKRRYKASSLDTERAALRHLADRLGDQPLAGVERGEAIV